MRKHSREPEQPGIRQHDSSGAFCTHVFFPKPSLTRLSEPPILRPFQGQQLTLHAQPAFRWRCLYLYIGSTRNVNVQPHNVLLTFPCHLPWNCNRWTPCDENSLQISSNFACFEFSSGPAPAVDWMLPEQATALTQVRNIICAVYACTVY